MTIIFSLLHFKKHQMFFYNCIFIVLSSLLFHLHCFLYVAWLLLQLNLVLLYSGSFKPYAFSCSHSLCFSVSSLLICNTHFSAQCSTSLSSHILGDILKFLNTFYCILVWVCYQTVVLITSFFLFLLWIVIINQETLFAKKTRIE